MKLDPQMDNAALSGFLRQPNQYICTSPFWYAYEIGRYFANSGRPAPTAVRMGRSTSIHVREMTFNRRLNGDYERIK